MSSPHEYSGHTHENMYGQNFAGCSLTQFQHLVYGFSTATAVYMYEHKETITIQMKDL